MSTLSIGASLLLPPLRERTELLHSLLPQGPESWESLSKGQVLIHKHYQSFGCYAHISTFAEKSPQMNSAQVKTMSLNPCHSIALQLLLPYHVSIVVNVC